MSAANESCEIKLSVLLVYYLKKNALHCFVTKENPLCGRYSSNSIEGKLIFNVHECRICLIRV